MIRVLTRAPSNIALVKYMGKDDARANLPANGSLSMTLDGLCTVAEVEWNPGAELSFVWKPVADPALESDKLTAFPTARVPLLNQAAVDRMSRHLMRVIESAPALMAGFGLEARSVVGTVVFRAANTFPASSGIASSASSFAALTLAMLTICAEDAKAFHARFDASSELKQAVARLSRQGSGSSCRSFDGPFVSWRGETTASVPSKMPELTDLVLLVGTAPKSVSSSEAHLRVKTSPLWQGRVERANRRSDDLKRHLSRGDFESIARLAWDEMWEMHSLFHTCAEPFTYWEPGSVTILKWLVQRLKDRWDAIVTMDAGPNVHILVRSEDAANWKTELAHHFGGMPLLSDTQGAGASILEIS